ncbi:DUF4013 domain-containing protein [Natronoglomus mannanivorans]|uniref:DUF4013 domain-containing protein n=1 Tax=Natronoglomus mannanivorans TaxID=2979990 RepID=A0AAP2Z3J2_9EURY|nr:DUF4013 domain-containing protein [Halobacteria archaeon AArc-xg1-1]
MLQEAISYLRGSDDVWKTSIIGGVLLLFGFLLIPLFLAWGYIVEVVDRTARGDDEVPVFEDWGQLTVDGAKAVAIAIVYSFVPAVIGVVLIGSIVLGSGETIGSLGAAGLAFTGLLTVGLLLAAAYAFPAAVAHFAAERRFGASFDVETLRPILWNRTYATRWLLSVGIVLAGSIVTAALNELPMIGLLLGSIVGFYALVAAFYVIGQTWAELHPLPTTERGGELSSDRPAV